MSLASDIVDEVRGELNDEDTSNLRWSDADMLVFVNAGQREIVTLLPEANMVEAINTITQGSSTKQTIPSDGIKFIKCISARDNTNSVRGPMMRRVERDALDSLFLEWSHPDVDVDQPRVPNFTNIHTDVRYEQFAHDPREPYEYWIYPVPPVSGTTFLSFVYCQLPADLVALSGTFALDDQYQNAMVEYVIYRCLSRDGRYGAGSENRQELLNNFRQVLGLEPIQADRVGPESSRPPEGP